MIIWLKLKDQKISKKSLKKQRKKSKTDLEFMNNLLNMKERAWQVYLTEKFKKSINKYI